MAPGFIPFVCEICLKSERGVIVCPYLKCEYGRRQYRPEERLADNRPLVQDHQAKDCILTELAKIESVWYGYSDETDAAFDAFRTAIEEATE